MFRVLDDEPTPRVGGWAAPDAVRTGEIKLARLGDVGFPGISSDTEVAVN